MVKVRNQLVQVVSFLAFEFLMNTRSARFDRYSVSPFENRYRPKRYDAYRRKSVSISEEMRCSSQFRYDVRFLSSVGVLLT